MSIALIEIVQFCEAHRIKHTAFGRRCKSDPTLIHDIAKGRQIGSAVEARIRSVMAEIAAGEPEPVAAPKFSRVVPAARGRRAAAEALHEAQHLIVMRDPCFNCGVRADRHGELGCRRWRAGE